MKMSIFPELSTHNLWNLWVKILIAVFGCIINQCCGRQLHERHMLGGGRRYYIPCEVTAAGPTRGTDYRTLREAAGPPPPRARPRGGGGSRVPGGRAPSPTTQTKLKCPISSSGCCGRPRAGPCCARRHAVPMYESGKRSRQHRSSVYRLIWWFNDYSNYTKQN